MESSGNRLQQEKQRKEDLARKIAALQAELAEFPDSGPSNSKGGSPKRKRVDPKLLVPETPSPRKKRKTGNQPQQQRPKPIPQPAFKQVAKACGSNLRKSTPASASVPPPPKPSNILKNLASIKQDDAEPQQAITRSTGFGEQAVAGVKRDEDLTLIEELEPGPYEHVPPSDDPTFEKVEPHSNIALKSRSLPHETFKDHLTGRYYLSPSQLYSCIRLQPDKQHYDVPVPGDWVTIAVVAERGPIKYTRAPVTLDPDAQPTWNKEKGAKVKAGPEKPSGRKYTNIKLIDFGARSKSSATGGKAAESVDVVDRGDGSRPEKVYRGGSRGAFETLEKIKEGDVIALLNPKIMKPYQRSNDKPHPVDNILGITPECASSIAIIGKSRDLGMCEVKKRDGKVCGSWCDKRQSEVCEYHIQAAVQHRRAGRAEFSVGTGGMTSSSVVKRKHDYDPKRKWGLEPSASTGATYIVSGHVVRGDNSTSSLFVSENMGREGQARAQRKMANDQTEKQLKKMLERDRDGMEAPVQKADSVKGKGVVKPSEGGEQEEREGGWRSRLVEELNKPKKAYSASIVRSLGFDPTHKPGQRRVEVTEDTEE
ncbi:hypothetical protein FA13DRAFT_1730099 [Coprinellus micaceus]|uniref:Zinc finger Mcm10/DnaG-type domain-containing protein n=1 Tax=Coprinellus micaceus TaxID=71717 RepID=A0A4Y7TIQ6_COPMI|nr:hypothetical protein FA13DRAFT_1730099 [Coprinellus micaceus]